MMQVTIIDQLLNNGSTCTWLHIAIIKLSSILLMLHLEQHDNSVKYLYLLTQVPSPTRMPTLAEAVDPITLIMCTAVEVSHLCSAVDVAIVLEYLTADQEMKLE